MKRSKSLLSKETLLSVSVVKEPVQDFSFISQLLIKDEVCKIAHDSFTSKSPDVESGGGCWKDKVGNDLLRIC